MFPQLQLIKNTSFFFTINLILQGFVAKMSKFKSSDTVGMSIRCGSEEDIVLNPTFNLFSSIIHGGWKLLRENYILLYLNLFKYFLHGVRVLQGAFDMMVMIYPPNISAHLNYNNLLIVTNLARLLFNTQVKALRHDFHFSIFINIMFSTLLLN